MTRHVLVAGGGTAGHVFPALAVARELTRLAADVEPVFVGTGDRLEGTLVPRAGFRLHHIDPLPLPRRLSMGLLRVPGALRSAVRRCVAIAEEERAVGAVTFGGYVSFPLDWACGRIPLPLTIHEQNAVPGLANRFAARWADVVAVTFPGSADHFPHLERIAVTGNPVRESILEAVDGSDQAAAREHFGLEPDRTTLLAFGGSQGSRTINRAVIDAASRWGRPGSLQVLHAAGEQLHEEAARAWRGARDPRGRAPRVRCVPFIDDMALAYAAADVVVCRAGATSIAELVALGKPALLVPYPHATRDHQLRNAEALVGAGAGAMIEDAELTGASLVAAIEPWLVDEEHRARVARNALALGRRDAARNVARLALDVIEAPGVPA